MNGEPVCANDALRVCLSLDITNFVKLGEANVLPKYGREYTIDSPTDGAWLEGTDVVTWRDIHGGTKIDLKDVVLPSRGITARPPALVCAYVACTVRSPALRSVRLAIGSDDGNKVWLNGTLIGDHEVLRGTEPDQDIHPAQLKEGANQLLVKVKTHAVRKLSVRSRP